MPKEKRIRPPQHQKRQPGLEYKMRPRPKSVASNYLGCGKLRDRVALITGGDSGVGRAVAVLFAKEGADVAVVYFNEHKDARETERLVESQGRKCLLIPGDIGLEKFCQSAVKQTKRDLGKIDILVNNAAEQHPQESITKVAEKQLEKTFRANIFAMFFLTKAAMPHFKKGGVIINTASVTAYKGSPELLDYSATKGAIVAFHSFAFAGVGGKEDSSKRGRPGTNLDAVDSVDVSCQRGGDIWLRHFARSRW
jgi:short chain dehydrogenase